MVACVEAAMVEEGRVVGEEIMRVGGAQVAAMAVQRGEKTGVGGATKVGAEMVVSMARVGTMEGLMEDSVAKVRRAVALMVACSVVEGYEEAGTAGGKEVAERGADRLAVVMAGTLAEADTVVAATDMVALARAVAALPEGA